MDGIMLSYVITFHINTPVPKTLNNNGAYNRHYNKVLLSLRHSYNPIFFSIGPAICHLIYNIIKPIHLLLL